jgi:Acetyltransferase (isoleucine patch superfamily)
MNDGLFNYVQSKIKGRKLCFWGENEKIAKILAEKGLKKDDEIRITDSQRNWTIKNLEDLKGKSGEYYILVPSLEWNDARERRLTDLGFKNTDFVFITHKPIIVSGDYRQTPYNDEYGNIVSGLVNGTIHLRGFDSWIYLGNLTPNSKYVLSVFSDCVFSAGNGVMLITSDAFFKNRSKTTIENNCKLVNDMMHIYEDGFLEIREGTEFLPNVTLTIPMGGSIKIGRDCLIAHDCYIVSSDAHAIFDVNTGERKNPIGSQNDTVQLGNHVWLGRHACLIGETIIKDGSIVGTHSLVKGSFPNNCVIAGNPAKVIKKDIAWSHSNAATSIESCPSEFVKKTEE